MRSVTGRLVLTHLLFAVAVLAGAGLLTYHRMADHFRQAEQGVAIQRGRIAADMVRSLCASPNAMVPTQIMEEVERAVPGVVVVPTLRLEGSEHQGSETHHADCGLVVIPTQVQVPLVTQAVRGLLLSAGLISVGAASLLALWLSRSLARPLQNLVTATEELAAGRWEASVPQRGPDELVTLASSFRTMAQRLEREFGKVQQERQRLQRLSAEVAHEIKTPLTSLGTYNELLQGNRIDEQTRQELLHRSGLQLGRLRELADYLVEMARLEAGAEPFERQEVDLIPWLREVAVAWAPLAEAAQVRLELDLPGEPSYIVLANRQRLGQALDNLLQNALRHAPADSTVRIGLDLSPSKLQATLSVTDQGPGVPPDLADRLFEPFAKGSGSSGLGLGLSLVRAVVTAHGGQVEAANQPEGGARFSLILPRIGRLRTRPAQGSTVQAP